MSDFMMDEGARPISEDDILKELAKTEEGRRLLEEVMASELGGESVGGGGELGQLAGIEQQSLPPQPQLPPQQGLPPEPTNREFEAPPFSLNNADTAPVPPNISNMSPAETHSMGIDPETGEEIIHPFGTHKEYLDAQRNKMGNALRGRQ